ncbi:MAG: bleomycin resistance protein [Nostoc sp.]|uniref:bleomycin resistance protein n=1 Tax=Nostoc sp. TaxID=1180 RepID=UPI002FF7E17B
MWLTKVDHIQLTYPVEVEEKIVEFYTKILLLPEIEKPLSLKANRGKWYALDNMQLHISREQVKRTSSKQHVCFVVTNLDQFKEYLLAYQIEIVPDKQPLKGCERFYIFDPAGNRLEIAKFTEV